MNERIKELALEAGMIYGQGDLDDFDMLTYMPKEVRFFELIVRACAGVADEHVRDGDIDIAEIIRRHFGVEK